MRLTSADWFCEHPIDFEHKKWLLLSFIQELKQDFSNYILSPSIDQLRYQLQNLEKWKLTKELFIRKDLKGIDFDKITLIYDIADGSKEISEINDIVDYSIEELTPIYNLGREVFRDVEEHIYWNSVGIVPNYRDEGYLILTIKTDIYIFYYKVVLSIVEIDLIDKKETSFYNTPQNIKLDLMKDRKSLPNPNVFSIHSSEYPLNEAIIPVIKKNLYHKLLF